MLSLTEETLGKVALARASVEHFGNGLKLVIPSAGKKKICSVGGGDS